MRPLPESEALAILEASRLGVLCLADDDDAYGIPLFYGYDGDAVYFHCHPGEKDHYIDDTDEACLVVSHLESEDIWESVHVFGPLEKLTLSNDIEAAQAALFKVPFPPAKGNLPGGQPLRTEHNVYHLRLKPERVTGVASTRSKP